MEGSKFISEVIRKYRGKCRNYVHNVVIQAR